MERQKRFNGKAIYQPSGKAAEYSPWACNFYTGCSNDCEYCYCKRGVLSHVWSTEPRLKKCFKDKGEAITIFDKEVIQNKAELQKTGILFSFTTDPMLPETRDMTISALYVALTHDVPVQILTKRADWLSEIVTMVIESSIVEERKNMVAFGFTLTGFDEKEPGASTNQERIEAMRELHDMGFKTFASIEPVIDPARSLRMIEATEGFCDLYKVGLISGKSKNFYESSKIFRMHGWLCGLADKGLKIYLKDSFLEYIDVLRYQLSGNFVNSDYNIFQ